MAPLARGLIDLYNAVSDGKHRVAIKKRQKRARNVVENKDSKRIRHHVEYRNDSMRYTKCEVSQMDVDPDAMDIDQQRGLRDGRVYDG